MALPSLKPGYTPFEFHSSHSSAHFLPLKSSSMDVDSSGGRPSCFSSTFKECAFVLTATLATAQTSLFGGLIVCISAHIADDIGMSVAEVTWLSAAQASVPFSETLILLRKPSFQLFEILSGLMPFGQQISHRIFSLTSHFRLAAGSFLLFFGRVADLFGRRLVLLFGMTCYSACLLIAGFATNPVFLDIFCGLIGLCSAASVPAAIGTLGAAYSQPSRRKNKAFACFSSGNPLGFGVGALLSGVVNRLGSWRASFWTLSVIYGVIAAFSWWTVPLEGNHCRCTFEWAKLTQLDWLGATAMIAGLALFLSGITYDTPANRISCEC